VSIDNKDGKRNGGCRSLEDDLARLGFSGPINPEFLELLMGFPIGWTAIDA